MTGKLLRGLGVLSLVVLVGAAVAALVIVKDRVRVVIASDEVAAGPDPVALLRDDVQTAARDVAALQQAVATNFETLANAFEQRAGERHGDVLALRQEVAALQARVDEVARRSAAIEEHARLAAATACGPGRSGDGAGDAVRAATPAELAAVPTTPEPGAGPASAPVAGSAEIAAPANTAPAPPVVAPEPVAGGQGGAAPRAGASFLSFRVPSSALRFDEPRRYVLLPELCRVGFDAKSTLHDFTGVTSRVAGAFRADFDDPAGAWTGEVSAVAASLATGVAGRDENMREHLDAKTHPDIRFVVSRFHPAADGIDVAKRTARGEIEGTMSIRGASKTFRMPIRVEVDAQQRVVLTGQAPLRLSDYGVPVPSQLGLISMQDEVVVWIALRARAAAESAK
jgi:polyisoprenoid-binding protein YceI